MGFLKKIFKPVSKVLDKIVPNEIKPALPYLSAFAPMMLGPGIMGSSMLQRGLMSGGLNLLGQLSQEGSEGDVNLLSTALAGGIGALTAPGTGTTTARGDLVVKGKVPDFSMSAPAEGPILRDVTTRLPGFDAERVVSEGAGSFADFAKTGIDKYGAESAGGEILGGLQKASKFLTDPGLVKYGIPAAQGTMDLAYADAVRQQRDFDRDQDSDDGGDGEPDRGRAVSMAMEQAGHDEQTIVEMLASLGYEDPGSLGFKTGGRVGLKYGGGEFDEDEYFKKIKEEDKKSEEDEDYIRKIIDPEEMAKGGRVGLAFGGIDSAVEKVEDVEMKENIKFAQNMDVPMEDLVEDFIIIHKRKPNSLDELKRFYRDKYEYKGPADVKMQETITERMTAKDGGMMSVLPRNKEMDYRGGGIIPMGSKERADDVPARLSKNEFVMTADAVRAAGGGSVNEGARRMYNLMNNLEARA